MSNERLMVSCIIDAMGGCDVATSDITGAFLQNYYNKGYIHINIEVTMVTLLEDIDPAY